MKKLADRVGQLSASTGSGDLKLQGTLPLHRSFSEGIGYGNSCYYTCVNEKAGEWEVGSGRLTKGENGETLFQRREVYSSSSSNRKVNFSSGDKAVFVSLPAKALNEALAGTSAAPTLCGDTDGKLSQGPGGIAQLETKIKSIQGVKVHNNENPMGEQILGVDGHLYASRVFNAVWNDIVDYQRLNDELKFGHCYFDTIEGARICTERCQKSVIGIASDTYGMAVGKRTDEMQAPFAVAGWVLAYVDKIYEPGTPLTNDANGHLTEMTLEEKQNFPERIVAIFKKPELDKEFGHETKVLVDGRCWVKVK